MNEMLFARRAIASSLLYVSCLVILIAGCGNETNTALKTDEHIPAKEHVFRQKVEGLLQSLDGKENLVRRSAYELCCEIRKETDAVDRLRLVAFYTNAIQKLSVDIASDHLDDEKGINDIDVRLRNSWHFVEWGTAALFDTEPDSLAGWTFLISAAGRYRDVLEMIEKKLSQRSLAARQRMRLDAFRRHISIMYESKVWGIGKTYWSLHDKIPPRQCEEIRKIVKRRLGVLPSEMAKDNESAAR